MSLATRLMPVLFGLVVAAPANAADSAPLGRLFFTPERRAALERQRTFNIQEAQTLQGSSISLDGVVYRSGGKSTVWINQKAQTEDESARTGVNAVVSPKSPGSALLAPGEDAPTQLKVGEAVNRATGERNTRLGGGVVVTPATPAVKR
jgi:hypothetical protein